MKHANHYRAVALLLLLPLWLSACKPGQNQEADAKEEPTVPVEVAIVSTGPIEAAYRGTATLEAENEATVMAKQGGVIEEVLAEEGDAVVSGQVLARLETDKLRYERARAQSDVQRLTQDFNRLHSVYQRNLVSREAYEKTKYELEAAKAAYDLTALALRESEIRAPFGGVVTARYIKRGNLIQPNTQAFRVTQLEPLRAQIFVPEREIHKLRPAHVVRLTVDAWPGRVFDGLIELINPVVDPETGTVKVTVKMKPGQPELRPGMFARAEILYDRHEHALLIPKDAVVVEDAANAVFVVKDGVASRRSITLGYTDTDHYEVLQGLAEGERVVTTGQTNLKDDSKVLAVNDQPAASEVAPASDMAEAEPKV